MVERYNYRTERYEKYNLPKSSVVYSDDMNEKCNCAKCGKEMKFGDGHTSLEIGADTGFGYCVYEECYEKEHQRKKYMRASK